MRPPLRFRAEQILVACSLSLIGLSIAARRALRNPTSWLSRKVDGATTLPGGAQ